MHLLFPAHLSWTKHHLHDGYCTPREPVSKLHVTLCTGLSLHHQDVSAQKRASQLCATWVPAPDQKESNFQTYTNSAAGVPAAKAAPKRRRGGKHRNKGLLAAEAAAEGGAEGAPDTEAGVQSSSDGPDVVGTSLARLQLDRLASNGAAGTHLPFRPSTPLPTKLHQALQ